MYLKIDKLHHHFSMKSRKKQVQDERYLLIKCYVLYCGKVAQADYTHIVNCKI